MGELKMDALTPDQRRGVRMAIRRFRVRQREWRGHPDVCICGHIKESHYTADGFSGEVTLASPRSRCAHLSCACGQYHANEASR